MGALQVIGDPVRHSKSPRIQGAMLAHLGVDLPYTAHTVPKGGLPQYLEWAKAHHIVGFNATMPHKEDLLPLLDQISPEALACQAVNTVCRRAGQWVGFNTDGAGCVCALEHHGLWQGGTVVVLGAGGAAKAVALQLSQAGAQRVWVCNRTLEKAQALAQADCRGVLAPAPFTPEGVAQRCAGASLLVNCTNLGMEGCPGEFSDFSFLDALPPQAGVMDLIYHPSRTQLLTQARRRGLATLNGLPMLIYQAVLALEHFLGRPLDRPALAAAAQQALEGDV